MKRWISSDMVKFLSAIPGIARVEVHPQGGDVDTSKLLVYVTNGQSVCEDRLHISGFTVEGEITDPDDTEIEMIEVTDGNQSDTGLCSDEEEVCVAYGRITSRLRNAGFDVVESMNAYF